MKAHLAIFLILAACSATTNPSGDDTPMPDAKIYLDAPPVVPTMITIGGMTTERSLSGTAPVAGVVIALFRITNESTPVGMATTDAAGVFSIMVQTDGSVLDAYLKATKAGYIDAYLYPSKPFEANFPDASVNMITPTNRDLLSNLAGGNQTAGKGLIGLQVRDAAAMPVAGATVASTPASNPYRYTMNDLPSSSATMTAADGVAFMFNAPPGVDVNVAATKAGTTFKSHVVKARADTFTTTSITP